tara:strand:- start:129 stop:338 length:210 start_codon:yes stop_codon:yes gene_type:complete
MTYNKEEDLIRILGWSVSSKLIYLMKKLNNINRDELFEEVVEENKLMKTKSFNSYMTRIDRIRDDVRFI